MECCIEYYSTRGVWQNLLAGSDSYECRRVVERPECAELFDACLYLVSDDLRLVEDVSSLYDPVTYSADLAHVCDNAVFLVSQGIDHQLHRNSVIRQGNVFVKYGARICLVIHMTVQSNNGNLG